MKIRAIEDRDRVCGGTAHISGEEIAEWGEQALDQWVGDALLEGVRLEKVMRARQALLAGRHRDLVLAFARETLCGETAGSGGDRRPGHL